MWSRVCGERGEYGGMWRESVGEAAGSGALTTPPADIGNIQPLLSGSLGVTHSPGDRHQAITALSDFIVSYLHKKERRREPLVKN